MLQLVAADCRCVAGVWQCVAGAVQWFAVWWGDWKGIPLTTRLYTSSEIYSNKLLQETLYTWSATHRNPQHHIATLSWICKALLSLLYDHSFYYLHSNFNLNHTLSGRWWRIFRGRIYMYIYTCIRVRVYMCVCVCVCVCVFVCVYIYIYVYVCILWIFLSP